MINSPEVILKYFPGLNEKQNQQFSQLNDLYRDWNAKINLISRKDIENLYVNHVLHSLGIAKVIHFKKNTKVIDVGTGGGFPGIPLAIFFPDVQFHLVDSIGKKIMVVNEIARELKLKNVIVTKSRAEEMNMQFDFVVSRAVATLPEFYKWTRPLISKDSVNDLRNGILYLKGGDVAEETKMLKKQIILFDLKNFFTEEFFETKKVVYVSS